MFLPRRLLAERGIITTDRANSLLVELVEQSYVLIVPTRALLLVAIHASPSAIAPVARAFALLGGPALDLSTAARIAAETVKAALMAPVQLMDIRQVTRFAVEALAMRWPPTLAAYALLKAAASEFVLLPAAFKMVRQITSAFVQAHK